MTLRERCEELVDQFTILYPPEEGDPFFCQAEKDLIDRIESFTAEVRNEALEEAACMSTTDHLCCDDCAKHLAVEIRALKLEPKETK